MTEKVRMLLVEDSQADVRLILEVFKEEKIAVEVSVTRDGEEALAYLRQEGKYKAATRPDLILLDLNMPRKDGREVLAEIKADEDLKAIPVVIMTTSKSEEDIYQSYNLQASCYVTKPIDLDNFVKIIRSLDRFWFSTVRFPARTGK